MATASPMAAPPKRAKSMPAPALSLAQAPTTAAKAPVSIIPSRPTAKTPARSERMPPSAAKSNGVAILSAAARSSAVPSIASRFRAAGGQAHRGQDEDHRQALDDGDERGRDADGPLHR